MTLYKRFVPPPELSGVVSDAAGFAFRVSHAFRMEAKRLKEAEPADRAEQGASLTVAANTSLVS